MYSKKIEVPQIIVTEKGMIEEHQGRKCYLSGIEGNEKIIRYLDTGEIKRFKIKTK